MPHSSPFQPSLENYTLHTDQTDVHICMGPDKGGQGMATTKLVATTPNQMRSTSHANFILLSTLPCVKDNNAELHTMIGPWVPDLDELVANGIQAAGARRALRQFLNGDLAFLTAFTCHQGVSARQPCVW